MRFEWNEDQVTFLTFLEQILSSGNGAFRPVPGWGRHEYGDAIDANLEQNGFFDVAAEDTLGPVMAAELIHQVAQLPVVLECAASSMLRPLLPTELPRPIAVIDGAQDAPVRFLPVAKSVVWITDDAVRWAVLDPAAVRPAESLFAYPMGYCDTGMLEWSDAAIDPDVALNRWRAGLAAELTGALKGGLESVLEHVRERQQFGRPLGSFQGVQHRLAGDVVQIDGARWMALRAAQSGRAEDATLALGYAQDMATRIGYDLHQFMGAMGLTLEHPLHRWTYRARFLRTALGGASQSMQRYTDARWGAA